ncbi:MAG: hypothetical protein ABMB14_21015 [Myxococcota bacterium]
MGFRAREVMRGEHEFVDGAGPPGPHPFVFRATWGPESVRDWLDPRKPTFLWQELDGEVLAGGLCDWTPCQGTLHLQYLGRRRIRYEFDFEVDGVVYRYLGDKSNLRWWNLAVTHTTCAGVVTERATGRLVSTGTTRFHLRDLPRFLAVSPA